MTISLQSESHWKANQRVTLESLRPIARRQIKSLLRRMDSTDNYSLYQEEIEKVIIDEQNRVEVAQRGVRID